MSTFCLLVDLGAEINDPQVSYSSLYTASSYKTGREYFIKALIDAGADVNITFGMRTWTPLMGACLSNSLGNVKLLLEAGADPNWQNSCGETPLHKAARHKDKALILELVKFGADINAHDHEGQTSIMIANIATGDGHADIIHFLRSLGATGELSIEIRPSLSHQIMAAFDGIVRGLARGLP